MQLTTNSQDQLAKYAHKKQTTIHFEQCHIKSKGEENMDSHVPQKYTKPTKVAQNKPNVNDSGLGKRFRWKKVQVN